MILAIDTATHAIGIALHDGSELIAEHRWAMRNYHTVQLAPEVALILRRANFKASMLAAIAVAQGPGSYTGLRIGMALAKGLALAHHLPLIGIPTLDILAYSQPGRSEPMLVVAQVGRGRVAGLWYKWGSNQWKANGSPEIMTWQEIIEGLEEETYICGEIEGSVREILSDELRVILAPPAFSLRRAGFLAEIAWERFRREKIDNPAVLVPIYLFPRTGSIQ